MSQGDPRASAGGVEPDNLDSGAIVMWSFVSVIAVVAVMFVAAALYNQRDQLLYRERVVAAQPTASNDVIHSQQGLLQQYGPPQPGGEYFRIPIDKAKSLVIQELTTSRQ